MFSVLYKYNIKAFLLQITLRLIKHETTKYNKTTKISVMHSRN